MEKVVAERNAVAARDAVVRNRGAAGIDRMTTEHLPKHLSEHWDSIKAKLKAGTYVPAPVKWVEISEQSLERFQTKVRELWNARQSLRKAGLIMPSDLAAFM